MSTARSVLVVTASSGLGEMIQHALEETGLYKVMLVDSDQEALLCIQTVAFTIAILDCELPGGNMISLASSMRQKLPKMRLLIVCSEQNPIRPAAIAFQPAGMLSKPITIPDLLETITKAMLTPNEPARMPSARAILAGPSATIPAPRPAPEWLQDANWAARHLTRLSLESSAEAALIVRDGVLWAYAGELSQLGIDELVEELTSFWEVDQKSITRSEHPRNQASDMVRFIRLDATQGEYMLYATSLGRGMVLSLAFESDTPFSTIRAQASYLARALATPPGSPLPPYPRCSTVTNQPLIRQDANSYAMAASLPPLLDDVPPPYPHQPEKMPAVKAPIPSWFQEASAPASLTEAPLTQQRPAPKTPPTQPAPYRTEIQNEDIAQKSSVRTITAPGNTNIDRQAPNIPSDPDSRSAHNPHVNGKSIMPPDLYPATPTLHYLTYSCTLIPRMPQHQLGGDLAQFLQEWMPQLCLAFSWQLLHMGIFPEYLQAIARVTPKTSPGSFVRIVRQQTSRRILTAFPRIGKENPSHDFWAPGYLILSNSQPPPNHVIRHFIEQTRLQQGSPLGAPKGAPLGSPLGAPKGAPKGE
jgi:CheY-like chemotaxis protein/REP element-mobilizing transposase RayT